MKVKWDVSLSYKKKKKKINSSRSYGDENRIRICMERCSRLKILKIIFGILLLNIYKHKLLINCNQNDYYAEEDSMVAMDISIVYSLGFINNKKIIN